MKFVFYPKCSTCIKAKKWLEKNNISYEGRDIVKYNPTKEELRNWIDESGKPIEEFFNRNGKLYKELELKDRIMNMKEDEKIGILSTNGMLVKRPILIGEEKILIGFKEEEWNKLL